MLVWDAMTVFPQAANDLGNMHGVPDQDGIGKQAQATGLVHDLGKIAGTELPLVGEKYMPGYPLAMLPAIELLSYLAPQLFVLNVLEDINRLYQATEFGQRL